MTQQARHQRELLFPSRVSVVTKDRSGEKKLSLGDSIACGIVSPNEIYVGFSGCQIADLKKSFRI